MKVNQQSLIHIQNIKYIFSQKLNEDYEIYFNRHLKDVYLNICKDRELRQYDLHERV